MAEKDKKQEADVAVETVDVKADDKDMVTITVQRRYDGDVRRYVSVNGKTCSVKTGVPVRMPRALARVIRQSERQKGTYDALVAALRNQGASPK